MPEPPLWDDVYEGPRWRYGLSLRPAAYANLPLGWIINSHRTHEAFAFGTIDFPKQLRPHVVEAFELTLVDTPANLHG